MKIQVRATKEGGLTFTSDWARKNFKQFCKENPDTILKVESLTPESRKMRGWFEGAIVPLVTFYQENLDHHDHEHRRIVREWLKLELNGELIALNGKTHKIAKSTKGELNKGFLERVLGYLEDNYAPPHEALDTEKYKNWRDTIYPYGGADNYIDYLVSINIL